MSSLSRFRPRFTELYFHKFLCFSLSFGFLRIVGSSTWRTGSPRRVTFLVSRWFSFLFPRQKFRAKNYLHDDYNAEHIFGKASTLFNRLTKLRAPLPFTALSLKCKPIKSGGLPIVLRIGLSSLRSEFVKLSLISYTLATNLHHWK